MFQYLFTCSIVCLLLLKRWYDSENVFSLRCNFGCVRRPRDSGVAGRSGPSRVPPSPLLPNFRFRLVQSYWSKHFRSSDWPAIWQSLLWLVEWKRGGQVFAERSSGLHVGGKKEKTDGKNCNPQNDHCLVTPRYGNICTHVETYLFSLAY